MRKTTGQIKFGKGEKFLLVLLAITPLLIGIVIVYSTASLSSSNIAVEKLKEKIEIQENLNESLAMQVDELASLSNIQDVAKENGLSYNNDNITVVNK